MDLAKARVNFLLKASSLIEVDASKSTDKEKASSDNDEEKKISSEYGRIAKRIKEKQSGITNRQLDTEGGNKCAPIASKRKLAGMDKLRKYIPSTVWGRSTLGLCIGVAAAVICLESVVASIFLPHYTQLMNTPLKGISVYVMIFLFSQLFQVLLCWDAVYHQNTIQVIGFVVFNACSFFYSLFQVVQVTGALNSTDFPITSRFSASTVTGLLSSISVILGVSELVFVWLAFKLFLEFGWKIYKKIGADPLMKNMYRYHQIFLTMLKVDFFFFMAFSVQFLVLVLDMSDPEFALTLVALPVSVLVLMTAVYGLRNESRGIMGLFIFGCLLAIAYFTFKLVRINTPSQAYKYLYTERFLTFFASLSLLAVFLTLINAIVCFMNFGKGLKQHIQSRVPSAHVSPASDQYVMKEVVSSSK